MKSSKILSLGFAIMVFANTVFAQCDQFCTSIGKKKFFVTGVLDYTSLNWSINGNFGLAIVGPANQDTVEVNFAGASTGVDTLYVVALNSCGSADTQRFPISILKTPDPILSSHKNPTTCSGNDGNIVLSGLLKSTSYNVSFSYNAAFSTQSLTSDTSGNITIPNLSAGIYSSITVNLVSGLSSCTSAPIGPDTLKDPAAPVIVSSYKTNTTTCSGSEGTIVLKGLTNGTSYLVNYKKGSTLIVTTIVAAGDSVVITGLTAGVYDSINVTTSACTSGPALGPYTIVDPTPPSITSVIDSMPKTCLGMDGSISLLGLKASTSYIVNYAKDAVPVAPVTISSNASGVLIITGLGKGVYSNITVTLSNCVSNIVGPRTLVGPVPKVNSISLQCK